MELLLSRSIKKSIILIIMHTIVVASGLLSICLHNTHSNVENWISKLSMVRNPPTIKGENSEGAHHSVGVNII